MRKLAVICSALIGIALLVGVVGCSKSAPSVTTTSFPNGEVNAAYSQTLAASSGSGTYSSWAITSGALPDGLSLDDTGTISGTPATDAVGISSFTVQVTDSSGSTGSEALSITIGAAPTITTTSLPDGTVGTAYSQILSASGGSGTYSTWTITSGALPDGLSIGSSGVISGTPTTAGTFNFIAQVADSNSGTGSDALSITIAASPTPIITTTSLPSGTVGTAYSQILSVSGGSGTYSSWAITSGALPDGLSLDDTGTISGTPAADAVGTSSFIAQATDSNGDTGSEILSITIAAAPSVTTTSLPDGTVGTAYSQILSVSGGSGTYSSWAITSGALPDGLSLDDTGTISGTPATDAVGISSFIVQVTDSNGDTGSETLSITVADS